MATQRMLKAARRRPASPSVGDRSCSEGCSLAAALADETAAQLDELPAAASAECPLSRKPSQEEGIGEQEAGGPATPKAARSTAGGADAPRKRARDASSAGSSRKSKKRKKSSSSSSSSLSEAPASSSPKREPAKTSHASAGSSPRPMSDPNELQLLQARRLRDKYRIGPKQYLAPNLLGFDGLNRDGIPIDADHCDELLGEVSIVGWDPVEANHDNVCVQVRPGSRDLHRLNRETCEAHEFLAPVGQTTIVFGTLSHSHLNQCLKNIIGGAKCDAPARFASDGRLCLDVVEQRQPGLAENCRKGLLWDVLSWKIRLEEGALEIVQSAANRKAQVQMRETEMQAIARLASICSAVAKRNRTSNAPAGGKIDFDDIKRELARTMPQVARSSDFLGMLRFVISLGANGAPFIAALKLFVGLRGACRHVKPSLFAAASLLPTSVPHLMIALIVAGYSAPEAFIRDGVSNYVSIQDVRALLVSGSSPAEASEDAAQGEKILQFFHRACVDLMGLINPGKRIDFLSTADALVIRKLTGKHLGLRHDSCPTLVDVAESLRAELAELTKKSDQEMPPRAWPKPQPRASGQPALSSKPDLAQALQPRLIEYDSTGTATNEQETVQEVIEIEECSWAETLEPTALKTELAKASLLSDLTFVSRVMSKPMAAKVVVERSSRGELTVKAKTELAVGEVALVPAVAGAAFLTKTAPSANPTAVKLNFTAPCASRGDAACDEEWYILPCTRLPPKGILVDTYEKAKFISPFWAMKRSPIREDSNCDMAEVSISQATSVGLGQEPLDLGWKTSLGDHAATIPVITNTQVIVAGGELIMFQRLDAKLPKKTKTSNWETVVGKKTKASTKQ